MNLIENGKLWHVDLESGIIVISVHEGIFKDRLIRILVDTDLEFRQKLGDHLGVTGGHSINPVAKIRDKDVRDHKVHIIIE